MLAAASLILAAVFGVAAGSKLADRPGLRRSIIAFGGPEQLAPALAWLLIGCELALAGTLLIPAWRGSAAAGGLGLLAGLSGVVAINVARGREAECHCFGRLSRSPAGWSTLARNGVLAAIAGYLVAGGRQPGVFAALALGCGGAWLGLTWLRQRARPGTAAPEFSVDDAVGRRWTLRDLLDGGRPVLLVFSHPGCGACEVLFAELAGRRDRLAEWLTVAVLQPVTGREQDEWLVLRDEGASTAQAYGVSATPSAALIDSDGRMTAALAVGPQEILELLEGRSAHEAEPRMERRALIVQAAQSAAALGVFPLVAAAFGSSESSARAAVPSMPSSIGTTTRAAGPKAVKVGNSWICKQTYALCTNAPCVPSRHDPSKVICDCVVKQGYSVGSTSCPQRARHGNNLYSEFSTALVTARTRTLTCGANVPWANCLDYPCKLDPHDPSKARCTCQLVKTGPSFTFGGDCNRKTCGKTIWSGAHNNAGTSAVAAEMKKLGQPLTFPPPCPKA